MKMNTPKQFPEFSDKDRLKHGDNLKGKISKKIKDYGKRLGAVISGGIMLTAANVKANEPYTPTLDDLKKFGNDPAITQKIGNPEMMHQPEAVDLFSDPRNSGFLQLVDGPGAMTFIRGEYDIDPADPTKGKEFMEKAEMVTPSAQASLASSVDAQIDETTMITHSIQIIGNHTLKLMCSGNGVDWYNFTDPAIGGILSPGYNNGTSFKGPYNGPVSIDFRSIGGGVTHLQLRWVAEAGTSVSSGDRVALTRALNLWDSPINPVDGVTVDFDNRTAVVNVNTGAPDVRGNIVGIYRSTDGGSSWQYQGDTNGYFYQQDIPNGQSTIYGAERRDAYGNKSARVDATPGQATCDGRPGETRIVGQNAGGTNVVLRWFPRNGTEVPCGTASSPLGWYEIYEGDIGQPLSTFSLIGVTGPTDTGWTGPMPFGNKCYIVLAVAADGTTKEQDMAP